MTAALAGRALLHKLRDEFAVKNAGARTTTSLESIEWKKLRVQTRILMLVTAGIDGDDLDGMARKDWHEFPRPEQLALHIAFRSMRNELMDLIALVRHL